MNKLYSLTCVGGPYGDRTYAYKGTLVKDATLSDFIDYVLAERPDEQGTITIKSPYGTIERKYFRGVVSRRPRRWGSMKVSKYFRADGGWTRMDYSISVEAV